MNHQTPSLGQVAPAQGKALPEPEQSLQQVVPAVPVQLGIDGHTVSLALAEFVAQPERCAQALADIAVRPLQVKFH